MNGLSGGLLTSLEPRYKEQFGEEKYDDNGHELPLRGIESHENALDAELLSSRAYWCDCGHWNNRSIARFSKPIYDVQETSSSMGCLLAP